MRKTLQRLTLPFAFMVLSLPAPGKTVKGGKTGKQRAESTQSGPALLWRYPADLATRNLFYGPGGKEHQPHSRFTFIKEDLHGSNPKFLVHDENGVKWTVKLGEEAQPETAASRLVWAAGYFANEDYFLREILIENIPPHLKRAKKFVAPDGSMHNVRLKRHLEGEEKISIWKWRDDPFTGTREFNGLRVLMAVINNWDLKDVNNEIYREKHEPELIYMVSDLGASFGATGHIWPHRLSKGNLDSYRRSKFITRVTPEYVDFKVPSRPSFLYAGKLRAYIRRLHLRWIGKEIPRSDARWMGQLLARLSTNQIQDAFRAAGYSTKEVEGFAAVIQDRIAELNDL